MFELFFDKEKLLQKYISSFGRVHVDTLRMVRLQGNCESALGNYSGALYSFEEALSISEALGDNDEYWSINKDKLFVLSKNEGNAALTSVLCEQLLTKAEINSIDHMYLRTLSPTFHCDSSAASEIFYKLRFQPLSHNIVVILTNIIPGIETEDVEPCFSRCNEFLEGKDSHPLEFLVLYRAYANRYSDSDKAKFFNYRNKEIDILENYLPGTHRLLIAYLSYVKEVRQRNLVDKLDSLRVKIVPPNSQLWGKISLQIGKTLIFTKEYDRALEYIQDSKESLRGHSELFDAKTTEIQLLFCLKIDPINKFKSLMFEMNQLIENMQASDSNAKSDISKVVFYYDQIKDENLHLKEVLSGVHFSYTKCEGEYYGKRTEIKKEFELKKGEKINSIDIKDSTKISGITFYTDQGRSFSSGNYEKEFGLTKNITLDNYYLSYIEGFKDDNINHIMRLKTCFKRHIDIKVGLNQASEMLKKEMIHKERNFLFEIY